MTRLRCLLLGHAWRTAWVGDRLAVARVCIRCRENGWAIRRA